MQKGLEKQKCYDITVQIAAIYFDLWPRSGASNLVNYVVLPVILWAQNFILSSSAIAQFCILH